MSRQFWNETLTWATANGAAIANTTTETILFPNITIPANFLQDGRTLRLTATGKLSNIVTTPGNISFLLRWGGVAGTILAQTSTINLNTTAQTDIMFRIVIEIVTRANGASGSLLAMGIVDLAFKSVIQPEFMGSAGGNSGNTPAAVTVDLTADTALALSAKFSVANAGNTITGMNYLLEALN